MIVHELHCVTDCLYELLLLKLNILLVLSFFNTYLKVPGGVLIVHFLQLVLYLVALCLSIKDRFTVIRGCKAIVRCSYEH